MFFCSLSHIWTFHSGLLIERKNDKSFSEFASHLIECFGSSSVAMGGGAAAITALSHQM